MLTSASKLAFLIEQKEKQLELEYKLLMRKYVLDFVLDQVNKSGNSFNGKTGDFQSPNAGSIPASRTKL